MTRFIITTIVGAIIIINIHIINDALNSAYELLSSALNSTPTDFGYRVMAVLTVILFLFYFIKELAR